MTIVKLTLEFECSSMKQAEELAKEVHGEFSRVEGDNTFPALVLSTVHENGILVHPIQEGLDQ